MTLPGLGSHQVLERALRYAPVMKFGKGEKFFPMNAENYMARCSLHYWQGDDEHILVRPPGYVELEFLNEYEGDPDFHGDILKNAKKEDFFLVSADHQGFVKEEYAQRLAAHIDAQATPFGLFGADLRRHLLSVVARMIELGTLAALKAISIASGGGLPSRICEQALKNYGGMEANPPTYYYRYVPKADAGGKYDVLQYWFFYYYNDWAATHGGINDHEADWEAAFLYFEDLAADSPPAWAVYSGHSGYDRRPWEHVTRIDGTHPVVYVRPGSHANTITRMKPSPETIRDIWTHEPGDWPEGDEIVGEPGGLPWAEPVRLEDQRWLDFWGRWGARYLWLNPPAEWLDRARKGGSPGGPKYSGSNKRQQWKNPVGWAKL